MDIFLHWLISIGSFLVGLFWFLMVLDCFTNKTLTGSRRAGWIILVLFTQAWGAAIYLFSGHSHLLPKFVKYGMKLYKKTHRQHSYAPSTSRRIPTPHTYPHYKQGYQVQYRSQFDADDGASQYYDPQFELPHASYPEMHMPVQS